MPPVTRRSQPSAASKKALPPTSAITQDVLDGNHDAEQYDNGVGLLNSISQDSPTFQPTLNSAAPTAAATAAANTLTISDTLHPLREMAERVGREVESFAESLDRFFETLPPSSTSSVPPSEGTAFADVLQLIDQFKDVAHDAVASLERSHRLDRAELLRAEWTARNPWTETATTSLPAPGRSLLGTVSTTRDLAPGSAATRKAEQVRRLRAWQQELDVWDLFKLVLELHHHPDAAALRRTREATRAAALPVHRYTTEAELWERFLLDDDVARERSLVKAWLEQTAEHQESDLAGIVDELEAKAGRGKGLWTHGWMHTRERIKGEKRLRAWPTSADAALPIISRSDNQELLAVALDPDAVTRQDRTLEKPDAYFERAIWMAAWEMLRRGAAWDDVRLWCEERKEGWRVLSMGQSTDPAQTTSNSTWRNMCFLASQSGGSNEYEAAVYGLLGGNVQAVQKICRTVDDHLYAYYSTTLVRQFDQYLASKFPQRITSTHRRLVADASDDPQRLIVDLIAKLRTQSVTSTESVQPMKILESYLLANDLDSMIFALGHAISYADQLRNGDQGLVIKLEKFWDHEGNLPEAEVALDIQTLRIAVHISFILNTFRSEEPSDESRQAQENLLIAYVQALRVAGKRDLIPLYASRLSRPKWVTVMSRVMQDITEVSEQEETLKLIESYGRDTVSILNESLKFCLTHALPEALSREKPLRMLEPADDAQLYPGQRIIAGFLPDRTSESDEIVVRSLQWFNILHGHWYETFSALTTALRKCLIAGRIACALKIVREYPYDNISIRKSFQVIGKSVNMMDFEGPAPADERQKWEIMARQSRTYYELGLLVNAVEAMSIWRELEFKHTNKRSKPQTAPSDLKTAKLAVDEAMLPLLSGILESPLDKEDDMELAQIRNGYIPEIIIAYNTVLHSAGSFISRSALVESMDLSVTIANDGNRLSECFVNAGRMRELVKSFAHTSKVMLLLKGSRAWTPQRKDREGKDLGIWEIGPQTSAGVGGGREITHASLN